MRRTTGGDNVNEQFRKAFDVFKSQSGKIRQIEEGERAQQYPCKFCDQVFASAAMYQAHVYRMETFEVWQIRNWLDIVCPDLDEFADKPSMDDEDYLANYRIVVEEEPTC